MIGVSDGTQYESQFEMYAAPYQNQNKETSDYDMAGAKADGIKPDERGHYPDTYKLPNHITFSDESKYNDGGAGHWEQQDNKWSFTPGPTNLKHHSMDEMRDYFKKSEPDSTLIEPKQDEMPSRMASAEQREAPAIDRIEQNKEILNPVRNVPSNTPIDLHQDNREQGGSHQWFKDQNKRDYTDSIMPVGATEKPAGAFNIERGYNVPLAASALTHDGESMYGVAVDHRIPSSHTFEGHTYDPAQFVALHEGAELPHMANLITGGQSAQDAYHEAHDKIATPTETAAVRAYAVKNNLNPDHFMDDYKQFWRDGAAMASEPSDKPRHPDAHTTKYGLDESELK